MNIDKICLIGGDKRQVYLAQSFAQDGKFVTCCALEKCEDAQPDYSSVETAVSRCDTVILPIPMTRDGKNLNTPLSEMTVALDESFVSMLRGKNVFCADSEKLKKAGDCTGCRVFDYLRREELAVLNAVPTAEGAIAAAINNSDKTLHESRCLVAGFGRIGKLLSRDLCALGAKVTVSARKPADLAWIRACGYRAADTGDIASAGEFDFIFNTVPAMVFDAAALAETARGAVVIDLSSKPGGVDLDACLRLHIKAVAALSLPGKVAPKTAAEIIKETIYNMAREENP